MATGSKKERQLQLIDAERLQSAYNTAFVASFPGGLQPAPNHFDRRFMPPRIGKEKLAKEGNKTGSQ
jgi:hypothetical protein